MIDYQTLIKDYKTFIKVIKKYNEEAARIFYKLKSADYEAEAGILHFGRYSSFRRFELECSDENSLSVKYIDDGYDIYDADSLDIPADILFDDEKIDKWIKSEIAKALEKKEQLRKAKEKKQEEKERQEYERLKEKFGI